MMMQTKKPAANPLMEIAERIREMREIVGYSEAEMAEKTEVSVEQYRSYEQGTVDFPFTFMHKCALAFGVELTDLLEGQSAKLSSYTVTRRGMGPVTASEDGITALNSRLNPTSVKPKLLGRKKTTTDNVPTNDQQPIR